MVNEATAPEDKLRQQLIAVLVQVCGVLTVLSGASAVIFQPSFVQSPVLDAAIYTVLLVIYGIAWMLNQRRKIDAAAFLVVLAINLSVYLITLPSVNTEFLLPMTFIAVYLASILLPLRVTVGIVGVNLVLLFIWTHSLAGVPLTDVFLGYWQVMLVFMGLIWAYEWYQRRVREARQIIDREYKRLFTVSRNALAILHGETIIEANPTFIDKITPLPQDGNLTLSDLFPDEHLPALRRLMAADSADPIKINMQPPAGEPFAASVTVSHIRPNTPRFLVSIRDVTFIEEAEQTRTELELERERVRLLHELIGDIRHDVNTPLSVIKTSLYLLEQAHNLPSESRHLRSIEQQSDKLSRMFDHLLLLSQLDKEQIAMDMTQQDINVLVMMEFEGYEELATQHHQTLTFIPHAQPIYVMVNPIEFNRALRQLMTNAVKYTPDGGTITVSINKEAAMCVVCVQDTGVGIERDAIPHLFKRFYRADSARNSNTGGMGLGLAIAERIMEGHGGKITVESQPNKGSRFCLYLPHTQSLPDTIPDANAGSRQPTT